ncbi:hypothetical protein KFE96_14210 [Kordiimonas sp. SCSIO 12603]|uniref:hypothetical protein n=1 Tax=Kordiimonas sp. SCSIO 12603 TaxID=2829596 RepID=UPI0021075CD0|nr:hypothetical protein [Kordiimonas sp. SCSIO 12603]UTW57968.1 hypothetical protein KFE96_14210 [Kordiimonas sp. SCSIO 12603]
MAKKTPALKKNVKGAAKGVDAPKKTIRRRRRRGNQEYSGVTPLLIMLITGLAFFKVELAMLVGAGMLPTFVMAFTVSGEHKSAKLQCVAFANLTGVLFKFNTVLSQPHLISDILFDPINILVMWGAAVLGHALIYLGPWAAAFFLQAMAQDKLKKLNAQKQGLVELWGHEVLGDKEEQQQQAQQSMR